MPATIYQTGEYVEKNPTYHVEDSSWKATHILQILRRQNIQPQTVGEIGCGAGEILRQLQLRLPRSVELHGYDISPQAIGLCQTRANDRLHFYCEDLLSITRAPLDLVLCMDVFEHVEDYLGFLRQLRSKATLKIFHIPLDLSVNWVLRPGPLLYSRQTVGHLHYFTKDTALATLRDTGYEIVDWFYTPSAVFHPGGTLSRLMRLPRTVFFVINRDWAARILGGYSLLVLAR
jgi:hypothetical protein